MQPHQRKAALAAYKERKPAFGIFAVICNATGEAWVEQSTEMDSYRNGLTFSLKMGGSPFAALQAAWTLHGEEAFRFEELDRLAEDFSATGRKDELKRRKALWALRLHARLL